VRRLPKRWPIGGGWHIFQRLVVLVALLSTVGAIHARAQSGDQLSDLRAQVNGLDGQGKYADAIPIAERYVALARQAVTTDNTQTLEET